MGTEHSERSQIKDTHSKGSKMIFQGQKQSPPQMRFCFLSRQVLLVATGSFSFSGSNIVGAVLVGSVCDELLPNVTFHPRPANVIIVAHVQFELFTVG